jgi:molybdate/tungstate transport system substrate-binding protein
VIDKMLIPGHADWNLQFCSNELCIVFTDHSKYADVITTRNWFDLLMRKDVAFGRSDPNADPCGYRSVMAMQLAEKHYGKPGLASAMLLKDQKNIRPKEVDLLALLETQTVDYIFLYKSVAIQHNLRYIELPEEVNLKNPSFASLYRTASVEINGKEPGKVITVRGEPMVYGITMLRNAPNRDVAIAFIEFMLTDGKGMKILNDLGQPSVIPQKNQHYNKLPGMLKKFALP